MGGTRSATVGTPWSRAAVAVRSTFAEPESDDRYAADGITLTFPTVRMGAGSRIL